MQTCRPHLWAVQERDGETVPQYGIVSGSADAQLGISRMTGKPFWVVTNSGVHIPIAIQSYQNILGRPAGTGNVLIHAEGELHPSANQDVRQAYSGHHSLELTFTSAGELIGDVGQV